MILNYQLNNFCGCIYKNGNVVFDDKKNLLFSPVGNRITIFDLENNISSTPDCQTRSDIAKIALSSKKGILMAVDITGYGIIINTLSHTIINHFNLKEEVSDIQFSPDGNFVAVSLSKHIKIYECPSRERNIEPLVLFKKYLAGHQAEIKSFTWSPDSRFILTTSRDNTVHLGSLYHLHDYKPVSFTGHRTPVIKAFFNESMEYVYTLGKDGLLNVWKFVDDYVSDGYKKLAEYQKFKRGKKIKLEGKEKTVLREEDAEEEETEDAEIVYYSDFEKRITNGRFVMHKKQMFQQSGAKINVADYHIGQNLFIVGFKNGVFGLYRITDDQIEPLQTLSISNEKISSICFNPSASWIAFACKKKGQLMVWEWRSQTYILNQEGLYYDVSVMDYSPNGNVLATGSHDGKIKLWDTKTFLCFATFEEHSSKVTGLKFLQNNQNTLISCSLDGTCRAFDSLRYRNFRTMTPNVNAQLNCLAVDPMGDIICAGALDPYLIYCWSLQTGNLIDIISGHEGPIVSLSFSPAGNILASGSWDKKVRLTDLYSKTKVLDTLDHNAEIMDISFRPDGKELCTTTMKGEIYLWDVEDAQIRGVIDCKRDLAGGRGENDKVMAKNAAGNKYFKSICYSADGNYILAGGNSKYICLYNLRMRILLKKFLATNNRSLDGIMDKLNSKNIKDGQMINENDQDSDSDIEDRKDITLPGSKKPNYMKRNAKLKIEVRSLKFSPNGKAWAAATTEGAAIFGINETLFFTPIELDEEVSLEGLKKLFQKKDYFNCLLVGLKLNEPKILEMIYQYIPVKHIEPIAQALPQKYLERFLVFLSLMIEKHHGIEFNLKWFEALFFYHGEFFKSLNMVVLSVLRGVMKSLGGRVEKISSVSQENKYTVDYILKLLNKKQIEEDKEAGAIELEEVGETA